MSLEQIIEIAGVVIGLVYLYLEYKASIHLWIVSIIMPAIYLYIFFRAGLYADVGINLYYLLIALYGWAAWNAKKAVLTLRNPSASEQSITLTLREALDIPAYVKTSIILSDAFQQEALSGLATGQKIDIDTPLTITMPASSVYIYNGIDKK